MRICGVAGKGRFGIVYYGYRKTNGEEIAVKKIFQDNRYKTKELKILKMINNPFLLKVKDHFFTKEENK